VNIVKYTPPRESPVPLARRYFVTRTDDSEFIPSLQWLKDATDSLLVEIKENTNLLIDYISKISVTNDGRHEDITDAIREGWNNPNLVPYILYSTLKSSQLAAHRYVREFLLDVNRGIVGDNSLDLLDLLDSINLEVSNFRDFLDNVTSATTVKLKSYHKYLNTVSKSIEAIYKIDGAQTNKEAIQSLLAELTTAEGKQLKLHQILKRVSQTISSEKQLLAAIANTSEAFFTKDLATKAAKDESSEAVKLITQRANSIDELATKIATAVSASRNIRDVHNDQVRNGGIAADNVSAGFHIVNDAPGQASIVNQAYSIKPATQTSYFPNIVLTEVSKMTAEDIVEELNALPETSTYIRAGIIAVRAEWSFVNELIEQLNNLPANSTLISGGAIILTGNKTVEEFYQEWAASSGQSGSGSVDPDLLSWFGLTNSTIINGDVVYTSDAFLDRIFAGVEVVGSGAANLSNLESIILSVADGSTQFIREIRSASTSGIWPDEADALYYKIESSLDGTNWNYIKGSSTEYSTLPRSSFVDYEGISRYLDIPICIVIEGNQASKIRLTFGGFIDEDDVSVAGNLIDTFKIYGTKSYIDGGTILADTILLGSFYAPEPSGGTLTVTGNADGSISITPTGYVDNGGGIAGYNIWRALNSSGSDPIFIGSLASSGTYIDYNTTHNTTYYYWATAFNSLGDESSLPEEGWASGIASYPAPNAPSGLISVALLGRIDISWSKVDERTIDYYVLAESSDGLAGTFVEVSSGHNNSVSKYGINATSGVVAQYAYKVKAVDRNGSESSYSNAVLTDVGNYQPSDGYAPVEPSNISVSGDTDGRIVVTWTGSTSFDANKYIVYRKKAAEFYYSIAEVKHIASGTTHQYIDAWLENGTTYSYKVSTIDNSGCESILYPAGDTASGIATDTSVSVPTGFDVTGSLGALNLSWTEISEPNVKYEVWRTKDAAWGAASGKLATVAGTSYGSAYFTDNDPDSETAATWSYKIRAIDRWNNIGAFTDAVSGTSTTISVPPSVDITDASGYIKVPFMPSQTGSVVGFTGLFQDSKYMGYVNNGTWKTYMDSSGNFYLGGSAAGNLSWNAASNLLNVSGTLWATSGKIGGWNIRTGALYKDDTTNSVGLAPADYPFYAGNTYANRATAPFRVTKAGVLTASSVNISGAIKATSGTIGGWTIGTTNLTNGNVGMAPATYPFFAGNATPASAPFRVDTLGVVTCSKINITSGANSFNFGTSGTIGGNLTLNGDLIIDSSKNPNVDRYIIFSDQTAGALRLGSQRIGTVGHQLSMDNYEATGRVNLHLGSNEDTGFIHMVNQRYGRDWAHGWLACSVNWENMTGVGAVNGCYAILTKESLDIMSLSNDVRIKCGSASTDYIHFQKISNETNGSASDMVTFGGESKKATFYGQMDSQLANGTAPIIAVSSTKCTNLNADMLDGFHSTSFLASSGTAEDSNKLNNKVAGYYATSGHTHSTYLAATGIIATKTMIVGSDFVDGGAGGSYVFKNVWSSTPSIIIPSLQGTGSDELCVSVKSKSSTGCEIFWTATDASQGTSFIINILALWI
jgi:fibronectin type 3 domain-containing protein